MSCASVGNAEQPLNSPLLHPSQVKVYDYSKPLHSNYSWWQAPCDSLHRMLGSALADLSSGAVLDAGGKELGLVASLGGGSL